MNDHVDEYLPGLDDIEDGRSVTPEGNLMGEEYQLILESIIDQLPEKQRTLVILYSYEGWTLKEIGKYLNLSEARTMQLYRQSMLHLKEKLMREE